MIPDGTKVRVRNVHADATLTHIDGFEGEVVRSDYVQALGGRYYIVLVNGYDYYLGKEELEIV